MLFETNLTRWSSPGKDGLSTLTWERTRSYEIQNGTNGMKDYGNSCGTTLIWIWIARRPTPILCPLHTSVISTSMFIKAASFCRFVDGLGCTCFVWEQCWIHNTFSIAAFWIISRNLRGIDLPLWMYWVRDIGRHVQPCRQEGIFFFSPHLRLAIESVIQKRLWYHRMLR